MPPKFERLVRFANRAGVILYGELGNLVPQSKTDLVGLEVPVFEDVAPWSESFVLTGKRETVDVVLSPIASTPIYECVGMNYKTHVLEAGLPLDLHPTIFVKPPDALAGPYDTISVHKECKLMDYEAELSFIIGQDCKNVTSREAALDAVLAYTAGNDVSSRFWQMKEQSGGQHGAGKCFDGFGPLGPILLHPSLVDEEKGLRIRSYVNGELRQDAQTNDFLFDVPKIIMHLTRGSTLRKGTVIMTGTPAGVAAFMKPPQWLKDGDVVEVEIEKIGRIRNTFSIEGE